jgi:quercetin dioxygenase-like cupin family protein
LILTLYEHEKGVEVAGGNMVVYDIGRNEAHFGAARVGGHSLVWVLASGEPAPDARLSAPVELDRGREWIARCDRIDFPPGGVAHTHTHPGPGIRCLLLGSIRIESGGETHEYGPLEPWFESGPEPVFAAASETEPTAFVRVMLLPREWEGKRTIRYVDPADADKPRLQQPTVFFDQVLAL